MNFLEREVASVDKVVNMFTNGYAYRARWLEHSYAAKDFCRWLNMGKTVRKSLTWVAVGADRKRSRVQIQISECRCQSECMLHSIIQTVLCFMNISPPAVCMQIYVDGVGNVRCHHV